MTNTQLLKSEESPGTLFWVVPAKTVDIFIRANCTRRILSARPTYRHPAPPRKHNERGTCTFTKPRCRQLTPSMFVEGIHSLARAGELAFHSNISKLLLLFLCVETTCQKRTLKKKVSETFLSHVFLARRGSHTHATAHNAFRNAQNFSHLLTHPFQRDRLRLLQYHRFLSCVLFLRKLYLQGSKAQKGPLTTAYTTFVWHKWTCPSYRLFT